MSDTPFKKALIRLAHEHPEIREHILPLLKTAAGIGDEEADLARKEERLTKELNKHVRGAGKVIEAQWRGDRSWLVVFDTEYAALKAYYIYRGAPKVRFGKSGTGDWYISTG